MPLSEATLSSELQAIPLSDNEPDSIDYLTTAFTNYFYDASVAGIPCASGSLDAAASAMAGALTGMSAPGAGAASLQAGCLAFWNAVVLAAPTIWVTVPPVILAVLPPGVAGLAAALAPVFTANTAGELDVAASCDAIAAAWHVTNIGGTATQQLPPAPPVVVPIL